MSIPEGYLPRQGDEVLIRARAKRDALPEQPDIECYLEIVGHEHQKIFLKACEIHSIFARYWNPGDTVAGGDFEGPGEVIAIDGSEVWVRDTENMRWTVEANELEPYVEPVETPLTITPISGEIHVGDTVVGSGAPFNPIDGKIMATLTGEDPHED